MADAKVIPFDDDRSRGSGGSGGQRPARRRGGGSRRKGGAAEAVPVRAPGARSTGASEAPSTVPGTRTGAPAAAAGAGAWEVGRVLVMTLRRGGTVGMGCMGVPVRWPG